MNTEYGDHSKTDEYHFRLFIAGDEIHSRTARNNLDRICTCCIHKSYKVEIVDVFEDYATALANNIFLTPALVMILPEPPVIIFGDLSNTEEVKKSLRL